VTVGLLWVEAKTILASRKGNHMSESFRNPPPTIPEPEQDFSEAVLEALPPLPPGAVLEDGDVLAWYQHGQLHRSDGPALVYPDGSEEWYQFGQLHRDDGPAVTDSAGSQFWYQSDELHRDDGPAVEEADGTRAYFRQGVIHRDDGPAISGPLITAQWYIEGKRVHRFTPAGRAVRREAAQNLTAVQEAAADLEFRHAPYEAPDAHLEAAYDDQFEGPEL